VQQKTVYLNDVAIGSASTWHEVAELVSKRLGRTITAREAQNNGSEGRTGFYLALDEDE
jgi:hypothetical protein